MSTVSKIMVVVVLVLSVCFSAISLALFAQRANWHALYDAQVTKAQTAAQEADAKIKDLNAKLSNSQSECERIKADNDNLNGSIQNLTQDIEEAKSRATQQETLAKEKDDQLAKLQEKVDNMIREIAALNEKMRRDSQTLLEIKTDYENIVNQLTNLRDKNNDLLVKLKSAHRALEAAKTRNEELTFALNTYKEKFGEAVVETKPKSLVRAHVLAVNLDAGVVMLSVGKDDNVELGMEFILHRGNVYLCKVKVDTMYPDSCVAHIVPASLADENVKINIGDNAFTN